MSLRIYLMGRISIERGGRLLDQDAFPGRQGLLTFARLMTSRESAVSRDELAAVLWDEAPPKAWNAALNAIVSKLRAFLAQAALHKSDVLPAALGCYQLNLPADTWVDMEAAPDALHEAEGFLRAGRYRDAWSAAQVAYHIGKRPFLTGETGSWAVQMRERLATGFARACECLAETYICNGEAAIAVDVARQAVAAQAFRENGHRLLMRAHAAAGNRADALLAYENCRRLISEQLGVAPSAETQAVYLEVLRSR